MAPRVRPGHRTSIVAGAAIVVTVTMAGRIARATTAIARMKGKARGQEVRRGNRHRRAKARKAGQNPTDASRARRRRGQAVIDKARKIRRAESVIVTEGVGRADRGAAISGRCSTLTRRVRIVALWIEATCSWTGSAERRAAQVRRRARSHLAPRSRPAGIRRHGPLAQDRRERTVLRSNPSAQIEPRSNPNAGIEPRSRHRAAIAHRSPRSERSACRNRRLHQRGASRRAHRSTSPTMRRCRRR